MQCNKETSKFFNILFVLFTLFALDAYAFGAFFIFGYAMR
ncbi:hypothetical protein HMPREF1576_01178 [Gardnerella pickettii JCP7719]|uniref:Uncharacterized protein n=1 Tax=Gardnerella pickettii JCP7719 TaxID=1261061 RepID=S4I674_9BIFI|nr:hypothetical protein HMPREF1576_01178 [Gardnerella pickettii JCP7719]